MVELHQEGSGPAVCAEGLFSLKRPCGPIQSNQNKIEHRCYFSLMYQVIKFVCKILADLACLIFFETCQLNYEVQYNLKEKHLVVKVMQCHAVQSTEHMKLERQHVD